MGAAYRASGRDLKEAAHGTGKRTRSNSPFVSTLDCYSSGLSIPLLVIMLVCVGLLARRRISRNKFRAIGVLICSVRNSRGSYDWGPASFTYGKLYVALGINGSPKTKKMRPSKAHF